MSEAFEAIDYQLLNNDLRASASIHDEATVRALLSNNFNVILGALRDAVAYREVMAALPAEYREAR